jgi:hypothetical protein
MFTIHLKEDEKAILLEMLESCINDLHSEIANTDNLEYKNMLKGRKAILIKLYESFQSPAPAPAPEVSLSRVN